MVIRVQHGKGQRDRHVMLSPTRLDLLRDWWRVQRPRTWLFAGDHPEQPIPSHAVREACQRAHRRVEALTGTSLRRCPVCHHGAMIRTQRLVPFARTGCVPPDTS